MAEKRRGLGRGIGALFPENQREVKSRPIDVFFAGSAASAQNNPSADTVLQGDTSNNEENTNNAFTAIGVEGIDIPNAENLVITNKESAKSVSVKQLSLKDTKKQNRTEKVTTSKAEKSKSTVSATDLEDLTKGKKIANQPDASESKKGSNTADKAVKTLANSEKTFNETSKQNSTDSSNLTSTYVSPQNVSRETSNDYELLPVPGATYGEIPLTEIVPNTKQPRQIFDEDDLAELQASISEVGILQPIVVRPLTAPLPDNLEARYELIMGERRWRASKLAGLENIPAIVRRTEDEDLLRDALLENLHRAQLNPLEEAAAYQQLLEDFKCTQEELARRIARSRPQITNTLRLMKLPPLVQRRVAAGVISAGHARALLGLADPAAMERLAQRIVAEGLSVRATEEIVSLGEDTGEEKESTTVKMRTQHTNPELVEFSNQLTDMLDTRVKITMGAKKGKIVIDFASLEDLARIINVLEQK